MDKITKKTYGQAIVEFALILPILFLFVFGFIQLSMVISEKQKLTFAAQYAAQTGALTNNDEKISTAISEYYSLEDNDELLNFAEVNIISKNGEGNDLIMGELRQYGDIVTVKLKTEYNLPFQFTTSEGSIFSINLETFASSRIVCNNPEPPYTCSYE